MKGAVAAGTVNANPPRGLIRWLLKLPATLYSLKLGWMLGRRFLLLIHTGRESGKAYATVLEALHYDHATHRCIIVSDWGTRSEWYKNVMQNPRVRYAVGIREWEGRVEQVSRIRAEQLLRDYGGRHRQAIRIRVKLMIGEAFDGSSCQYRRLAARVPVLEVAPIMDHGDHA